MNNSMPAAKLLLVDDERRFIDSLHSVLKYFDYTCVKAYTGEEAISLLSKEQFDLALLDVELPDMSGYDIAEYVNKFCLGTTSIMLTGVNSIETAILSMKKGAYDFLSKPFHHETLTKTIDRALQHNRLKKELQISNQRFQTLAEASWEGIVILENGRIIEANQQFFDLFGYGPMDIDRGLRLDDILQADNNSLECGVLNCPSHMLGLKKDGNKLHVEAKSRTIKYLNRNRLVCAIRDISDRINIEREKLEMQASLAKADKLNALGLMAGSVAHDLNNILSGVVSYPDMLLMQMDESDKYFRHIQKIQAAGKRAAAVVSDLLTITRGEQAPMTSCNLNEIILGYLNSLEHGERQANFPDVMIQTRLQKNLADISCCPQHIHKILLNLVGNALEAIEENGTIRISTESCLFTHPIQHATVNDRETDHIKLTITDNGPGIKQEDIARIFEPFYSTKTMGKSGTGLGLSIVWNIIQQHNGWIDIKQVTPGVTFELYFPSTSKQTSIVERQIDLDSIRGNGEKILIIDDQAEQNEIVEKSLQGIGYMTFSVTSGEEGIEYLIKENADLVLLDMMMGDGFDGSETLEIIQQNKPHQRVIVVSGYAKNEDIRKINTLGITHFLEKPVTLPRLGAAIRKALVKN